MLKSKFNIIILLLLIMSILTGCYGQYKVERDYYLANRKYQRLLQNVDLVAKEDFQELIVNFRKIVIGYPTRPEASYAQLKIANLYNMQNMQDKALEEYKKVIENYPASKRISSEVLFAIGAIYQRKHEEEKAEVYFNKALEDYPHTKAALKIPLYLARFYKGAKRTEESNSAYTEAIKKYTSIINEDPNDVKAISALDYLLACFADAGRWEEAVVTLNNIVDEYPKSASALKALFIMGQIYERPLDNKEKAKAIYEEMIRKFPDNPLVKALKNSLNLEKKK